jgi:hypothetical protein
MAALIALLHRNDHQWGRHLRQPSIAYICVEQHPTSFLTKV